MAPAVQIHIMHWVAPSLWRKSLGCPSSVVLGRPSPMVEIVRLPQLCGAGRPSSMVETVGLPLHTIYSCHVLFAYHSTCYASVGLPRHFKHSATYDMCNYIYIYIYIHGSRWNLIVSEVLGGPDISKPSLTYDWVAPIIRCELLGGPDIYAIVYMLLTSWVAPSRHKPADITHRQIICKPVKSLTKV